MQTCVTQITPTNVTRLAWSPQEFAKTTGLSLGFVRKEIRQGGIVAVRAGRRLLIPDVELRRYLSEGSRKAEIPPCPSEVIE